MVTQSALGSNCGDHLDSKRANLQKDATLAVYLGGDAKTLITVEPIRIPLIRLG